MASRRRHSRVHSGQIVTAQAAVAVMVLTSGHPGGLVAATLLLALAFARLRGRWLFQWVGPAAGLAARAARGVRWPAAPSGGHTGAAVLEISTPAGGIAAPVELPPVELLATGCSHQAVSLVVSGCAPPDRTGPVAASYRELAGDGALTTRRLQLAVQVPDGEDLDASIRRIVRRIGRQLAPLTVRPLPAWRRGTGPAAPADGATTSLAPVRERWSAVRAGGLDHVAYHLSGVDAGLLPRLLALPAVATTAAVRRGEMIVRVACAPDDGVPAAERALRALLADHGAALCRLDGEHLPGIAATLPGLPAALPPATPPAGDSLPQPRPPAGAVGAGPPAPRVPAAGVALGRDRAGAPVLVELFGPAPVRMLLVGDLRLARLLVWRALGAGAGVRVHTGRREVWEPLWRAAAGAPLEVTAPGPVAGGRSHEPVLHLFDSPVAEFPDPAGGGWCAQVAVRPRVAAAESPMLSRAETVVAWGLEESESTLVSAALGLGRAGAALRQVDPQSLIVISHGTLCEVVPSLTAVERDLVGGGSATAAGMARSPAWVSS